MGRLYLTATFLSCCLACMISCSQMQKRNFARIGNIRFLIEEGVNRYPFAPQQGHMRSLVLSVSEVEFAIDYIEKNPDYSSPRARS